MSKLKRLKVPEGYGIGSMSAHASAVATKSDKAVSFEFEGVRIEVPPGSIPAYAFNVYERHKAAVALLAIPMPASAFEPEVAIPPQDAVDSATRDELVVMVRAGTETVREMGAENVRLRDYMKAQADELHEWRTRGIGVPYPESKLKSFQDLTEPAPF